VPPLEQDWSANLGRAVVMTPVALRSPAELRATWRRARREIVGVAILCPLAYILVLTAMVFTPVSYVAPAREISILFGALIGVRLLDEGDALRRTLAAAAMAGGIVCLALG
jgi:drug/metabolite transporter (DMT)-like permease